MMGQYNRVGLGTEDKREREGGGKKRERAPGWRRSCSPRSSSRPTWSCMCTGAPCPGPACTRGTRQGNHNVKGSEACLRWWYHAGRGGPLGGREDGQQQADHPPWLGRSTAWTGRRPRRCTATSCPGTSSARTPGIRREKGGEVSFQANKISRRQGGHDTPCRQSRCGTCTCRWTDRTDPCWSTRQHCARCRCPRRGRPTRRRTGRRGGSSPAPGSR